MPRRGGPIEKRPVPNVKRVVAVASGKGGVGKSTIAVNLATALALLPTRPRVGLLDLDVFGPSVPRLMGLERADEPRLTDDGAMIPLTNHGLPCMSIGFLLPRPPAPPSASPDTELPPTNEDTPIVWRGLMVQKAVQQLLFDVDWREELGSGKGQGLDVLVLDMPPGTGDVPLTLGQLVVVDGAVIVSTPQDVALADVRKGVSMFRKISVPITGIVLNESYFTCPSCTDRHQLFGSPDSFRATATRLGVDVLGELPLVPMVSEASDRGVPYMLSRSGVSGSDEWSASMARIAGDVWKSLKLA
ncbi:hypothetical protein EIP86_011406 [Pleurotus ostreatoroseus]|nr:hypothetical protein EIP86_011406 [Pleurotus ostreatoroseus]